jgi:hypothetical protein
MRTSMPGSSGSAPSPIGRTPEAKRSARLLLRLLHHELAVDCGRLMGSGRASTAFFAAGLIACLAAMPGSFTCSTGGLGVGADTFGASLGARLATLRGALAIFGAGLVTLGAGLATLGEASPRPQCSRQRQFTRAADARSFSRASAPTAQTPSLISLNTSASLSTSDLSGSR